MDKENIPPVSSAPIPHSVFGKCAVLFRRGSLVLPLPLTLALLLQRLPLRH